MSAQDNLEKALRSLHVLLSQSEQVPKDASRVIVDKQKILDLLADLNQSVYQIMDEYELTKQSRDKAERDVRKQGEEIIRDASRKAEDIYAASVMYTDEALSSVYDIMKKNQEELMSLYESMEKKLKAQEASVRKNQSELKSQLQDLVDTEKYLKLIEASNREREKQKARNEGKDPEEKGSIYANRQTEIRVNTEVLQQLGLSSMDEPVEEATEEAKAAEEQMRADLDSDYFAWVDEQGKASGDDKKDDKKENAGRKTVRLWSAITGAFDEDK